MSSRVFELVGPPGAGKSTIARGLLEQSGGRVVKVRLREWRNAPAVAWGAMRTVLPFLSHLPSLRQRRAQKFSELIQAHAFYRVTQARARSGASAVLLDQGPVYLLSILQRTLAEDPRANSRYFLHHWDTLVGRWARRLDLIVLLDAGDDALHRRITGRGNRHPMVGASREQTARFLENARHSRDRIVERLQEKNPRLEVVRFDTEEVPAARIIEQLMPRLAPAGQEGGRSPAAPGRAARASARPRERSA